LGVQEACLRELGSSPRWISSADTIEFSVKSSSVMKTTAPKI